MTEFELIYLLEETRSNMSDMTMTVLTMVSAYLVVAVLRAHRLTRIMIILINTLFVIMMIGTAFLQIKIGNNFAYIRARMVKMEQEGVGLAGHPALNEPEWAPSLIGPVSASITLIIMFGALYFFSHARRTNGANSESAAVDKMIDQITLETKDAEETP